MKGKWVDSCQRVVDLDDAIADACTRLEGRARLVHEAEHMVVANAGQVEAKSVWASPYCDAGTCNVAQYDINSRI
jgi:hypothetical protein